MKNPLLGLCLLLWNFPAVAQNPPANTPAVTEEGTKTIVTVSASTPKLPRKSEGDVIELKDGRLLLVSMEFGGDGSDFARTRFVAHESGDVGRTWGPPRLITDTSSGDLNVYSPNLIRAKDGGILLLFMRQHRPGSLTNQVWKSTDEGQTFSPFAEFVARRDFALCNSTVKRLASGRLLLPANPPALGKPVETGPYAATALYSDDDGLTWHISRNRVELPMRGAMEPHVEQTGDGRVLMVMRSQLGKLHFSESADEGVTWSSARASDLTAPESCPELTRIPGTNDLLMIWNNAYDPQFRSHYGKRSPLTAAISKDHGQTWKHVRDIEAAPQRAFSNPGCRFTRSGKAILNYWTCEYLPDWSMQDVIDLRVAVIDTAWFYGASSRTAADGATEKPNSSSTTIETSTADIQNPRFLAAGSISCERIALGQADDYKPCIARMPDGELLLTAFHQHQRENGKVMEQTLLFRSKNDGKSWSRAEQLDLLGREPYLTVLRDGTIFITGHLLTQDVRNEWGYTTGFLHRSTDRGRTWQSVRVESEGIKPKAGNHTSRNVLQLADGSLVLGVDYDGGDGPYFLWQSSDGGKTWDKTQKCEPQDFKSQYGFFGGETWLWQARSGKIWALVRVDSNEFPIQDRPIKAGNDQADHFILFSSRNRGKTFDRIRDFGDYGEMYMSLLRLQNQRLLLTFTVRDLHPPLGVRAIPGVETDDGFEFDFTQDRVMLDTKTPIGTFQGGGFGPSVQVNKGTLVTSYSWRGDDKKTHLEVVRWKLPESR